MFGSALENWSVLSAEVNKTHFTVTVGCSEVKSFKLHQKLNKIPRRAFGVLGSDKYSENKFTVSIKICYLNYNFKTFVILGLYLCHSFLEYSYVRKTSEIFFCF